MTRKFKLESENKFIAFVDILGFSEMHDVMEKKLDKYMEIIRETCRNEKLQFALFSDNALLYTTDNLTDENFPDLLLKMVRACSTILSKCISNDIPIRGCISCGKVVIRGMENDILITGKPIIDAVTNEKIQNWVGIIISPKVIQGANWKYSVISNECLNDTKFSLLEKFIHKIKNENPNFFNLIEYKIPTNDKRTFDGIAVIPDTFHTPISNITLSNFKLDLESYADNIKYLLLNTSDPEIQLKYHNTLEFISRCTQNIWDLLFECMHIKNNGSSPDLGKRYSAVLAPVLLDEQIQTKTAQVQ